MEQLIFELATPEPPTFANFLPGPNREAMAALARFASGRGGRDRAGAVGTARRGQDAFAAGDGGGGRSAGGRSSLRGTRCRSPSRPTGAVRVGAGRRRGPGGRRGPGPAVHALQRAEGHRRLAGRDRRACRRPGCRCATTSAVVWAGGWSIEVLPLADEDKPAALATYARSRGFTLGDDVIAYLLAHGRRDMTSLVTTLAALDRHSLASKRADHHAAAQGMDAARAGSFRSGAGGTTGASTSCPVGRRQTTTRPARAGAVNSLIVQLKCWVVQCLGRRGPMSTGSTIRPLMASTRSVGVLLKFLRGT